MSTVWEREIDQMFQKLKTLPTSWEYFHFEVSNRVQVGVPAVEWPMADSQSRTIERRMFWSGCLVSGQMSVSCDLVALRGINKKWLTSGQSCITSCWPLRNFVDEVQVACLSVQIEKLNILCTTDCILNSNTGVGIITIRSSRGYRFST
jgi:hypothetical protein